MAGCEDCAELISLRAEVTRAWRSAQEEAIKKDEARAALEASRARVGALEKALRLAKQAMGAHGDEDLNEKAWRAVSAALSKPVGEAKEET